MHFQVLIILQLFLQQTLKTTLNTQNERCTKSRLINAVAHSRFVESSEAGRRTADSAETRSKEMIEIWRGTEAVRSFHLVVEWMTRPKRPDRLVEPKN
jgi:hypothetical protein